MSGARSLGLAALALLLAGPQLPDVASRPDRVDVVIVDPGHGGPDFGARGASGTLEKDLVLEVSNAIGRALAARGFQVVYTRQRDTFVSLAERSTIANQAGGDLFLSVHANSAPSPDVRGSETFFLSVEASDDEAMQVALVENAVFDRDGTADDGGDIVGSILGDLIRTEHLQASSTVAAGIQRRLASVGHSRGVKQAPFVVLMGVNMPGVLLELGFLTHPDEGAALQRPDYQRTLARAVTDAVVEYRAARERTAGRGK